MSFLSVLLDRNLAEPKHLPYLQLPEDRILFMSNAAARFLFPPQDSAQIVVDEFLEWESTKLSPTLAGFGGGAKVEVVKSSLAPLFKKLDAALANKKFLVNVSVSVNYFLRFHGFLMFLGSFNCSRCCDLECFISCIYR